MNPISVKSLRIISHLKTPGFVPYLARKGIDVKELSTHYLVNREVYDRTSGDYEIVDSYFVKFLGEQYEDERVRKENDNN